MSPVQEDGDDDDDCVRPFLSGSASSFSIMTGRKPGDSGKTCFLPLLVLVCDERALSGTDTEGGSLFKLYVVARSCAPLFLFFVRLGLFVSGSH